MLWQYPCKCSYPDCICLFWLVSLWLIVWLEKSQWKNWVFDPELKWLLMQCKIMEAVSFESMECFPKSKLSCYRGDRKIHSSERNQYWIFETDISRYFPQKTVTKSWRCYKPNMCYIFFLKNLCTSNVYQNCSHVEQALSVKRNMDIQNKFIYIKTKGLSWFVGYFFNNAISVFAALDSSFFLCWLPDSMDEFQMKNLYLLSQLLIL